jgi:hypothetical protein
MTIDSFTQTLVSFAKAMLSPASFKNGDFKIEGPAILVLPTVILIIALSIWSFIWLYLDAKRRNKSGILAITFILITGWPFSFLWWFWLRPQLRQQQISCNINAEQGAAANP